MNKFIILMFGALLLDCAQAFAAEEANAHRWAGCYAGANLGGGWRKDKALDTASSNFDTRGDVGTGAIGGGQIGCDYQFMNSWLIGLQGMFDAAGINGNHPYVPGGGTEVLGYNSDWAGSVTGRVGYIVMPEALLYIKSGITGAHINYSDYDSTGLFTYKSNTMRLGWTVGGGAEMTLLSNWSSFIEYTYADLGDHSADIEKIAAGPGYPPQASYRETHNLQMILIGLNYRFITW